MVLDKLSTSLKESLKKIARAMSVDESLINELVKDIQRALLAADVNVELVFELSKRIKERALKETPPKGINQREYIVKVVYEELVRFLGEEKAEIKITKKPFKIMLVGTFGHGKTTQASKIANYFSKRGNKVALIQTDVWRPTAYDQLKMLSEQIKVPFFGDSKEKDSIKIYKKFEKELERFDIIIIDTAGRDALSKELIDEIKNLNKVIKPDEKLLVIGADIGQVCAELAEAFNKTVGITGIVITKLDGTAKGGGALTGAYATGAKVKFIGVGEKVDDLELFNPTGFVSRLLGMGDLELLLAKAEEVISKESAEDLGRKFLKGEFNFIDLYEQMEAMNKMGPLSKIMDLVPGFSGVKDKVPENMLKVQESKLKKWKFIMQSLTKEELENPELLDRSRIERVARGSGTTSGEVRELLKQYRQSKKLVKLMKGAEKETDINKLMKKFKRKINYEIK